MVGEPQKLPPNVFTRIGYVFAGWALSLDHPPDYPDGASITNLAVTEGGVVVLFAKWYKGYTVLFSTDGGAPVPADLVVSHSSNIEKLVDPARAGYIFLGWYMDEEYSNEWCWDWYGTYTSGTQTNPDGATAGTDRILRGGNFESNEQYLRSAFRYYYYPYTRDSRFGLRVVQPGEW